MISLAWYLPAIKAQGNNQVLTRKDYLVIALKYGFAFTCLSPCASLWVLNNYEKFQRAYIRGGSDVFTK